MKTYKHVKIFIADKIHDEGIKLLSTMFKVHNKHGLSNDKLISYISSHRRNNFTYDTLVIRSFRKADEKFIADLKKYTSVGVICTVSSGFENIDFKACRKYKIKVFSVPNGNYMSAAEHTIALILAIAKKLPVKYNEMRLGKFKSISGETTELYNKTLGIIGVGRVGSHTAKIAKSFGMNILGNDIKRSLKHKYKWIKFVTLNNLLKNSDIITVHTPLDDSTKDLINERNINFIRKSAVILNCARGGIINEKALYNSLKFNRLYYAGLDVFENEPDIDFCLTRLKNVIATPHIAGKTRESYKRMAYQAAEQLINFYKQLKLIEIHAKFK